MTCSTTKPEAEAPSHKSKLELLILKLQTGAISEADRTKIGEQLGMAMLLSPQAAANEALQNSLARELVNFVKLNGAMMVFDFLESVCKAANAANGGGTKSAAGATRIDLLAALGTFSHVIEERHRIAEDKFRETVEALINIEPIAPTERNPNEKEAE
jgi:hypothetical protein